MSISRYVLYYLFNFHYFCLQDDTTELLKELNAQMAELLRANQELRAENERLRRIY